ncbi:MAG: 2-hydroxyacyl-CoA dehydratase [Candidatus Thermoplasmatota archaeon]|nr:2-hydroxyacyl-CoA dehydratase [Candidatus Thermoplasmatota archaeon]
MGIDLGSTTAKLVVLGPDHEPVYRDYRRHNVQIARTLGSMIEAAKKELGDLEVSVAITGSAGLGVAERFNIPFVQEVVAAAETVRKEYPDVRTLIDVGGEDSKMIFFDDRMRVDIRMNGNCAGGTGAFIDQMATLLNVPLKELDDMVIRSINVHPIASRCGVFAKTDVQNLMARKISKEDIAASVFHAVALQTVSTLSRGYDPRPKVMFCGGPFTFLPELKKSYMKVLDLTDADIHDPQYPEMIPAIGTAIYEDIQRLEVSLTGLENILTGKELTSEFLGNRLDPLFENEKEYRRWSMGRMTPIGRTSSLKDLNGKDCFLGVDTGSTTTKVVLTDNDGNIAYRYYSSNHGDPIMAVKDGLEGLRKSAAGVDLRIVSTAVTGYGEDLIKAAYGMDIGMVETLAHFRAAREFQDDVTFILDIGGQDMKAIFIHQGVINDIEINEACSSGCGSFIETFSNNLGESVEEFALKACHARQPYDLGTRCTVFMNSKVKQALREGASVGDISAGLAFSVVKNCLYKVLKIKDTEVLGDRIVVQGGTFRNPAVHRALELILGEKVICSDSPELMGAYGAALTARDAYQKARSRSTFIGLDSLELATDHKASYIRCQGCQNNCMVTRMTFRSGKVFHTGNKCERIFTNKGRDTRKGENLADMKLQLLFDRDLASKGVRRGRIGIPRVLNMFENFPFWSTLLTECGFDVVLSPPSTSEVQELGSRTVMSENICFPAKLVNGHVMKLASMKVDRIFLPIVVYEKEEFDGALNTFNCPVVSGYPDVVRSAVDPTGKYSLPFDSPTITFRSETLLKKATWAYLKGLGVPRASFSSAFAKACESQKGYKDAVRERASVILEEARKEERLVVLLVGRPYHIDHLINHKITEMIANLGADVITEDSIPLEDPEIKGVGVLTQWQYPNRVYKAVQWAAGQDNVEVVQLNSFGCGPDALVCDEARTILSESGKNHTLIRIDEVSSPGSINLRLRSMMESLEKRGLGKRFEPIKRKTTPPYLDGDRKKKIIAPDISRFYSPMIISALRQQGYDVDILPEADRASVEVGLKYCNNEICYPAIIVIGDILKALLSGKYDPKEVVAGITQTGGQCRASSYLSLLNKALSTAGFDEVPIITLTTSSLPLNYQPGMKINMVKLLRMGVQGVLFADSIMQMYYATAVRERSKGEAHRISEKYINLASRAIDHGREMELSDLLDRAVFEFNRIETDVRELPVIGFVGEIFVKYNPFANYYVVDWMVQHGIEVIVPPMFDFFAQEYLNQRFHVESRTRDRDMKYWISYPEEWYVRYHLRRYEKVRSKFKHYRKNHYIGHLSKNASDIVSMVDQFGEGWLIPAEIGAFAEENIHNVVCVQPFGCISNHIIGKGVEKALKVKYPDLNVLYLDMDAGSSEVNLYNRLSFIIRSAREDLMARSK